MTDCVICQRRDQDPDYGQCCPLCPSRLSRRLQEIPGLVAELYALGYVQRDHRGERRDEQGRVWPHFDQVANALPSGPINGARSAPRVSGTSSAPVPIRIDPTDLLAPARLASTAVHVSSPWPEDQIGHLAVATELDFWARDWADQRGEGLPTPDVATLARWLDDRIDWAVEDFPALDEMAEKVRRLHGSLMAALGLFAAPPKSMEAPCRNPDCEGAGSLSLFQEYPGARIECSMCTGLLSEDEYAEYVRGLVDQELQSRRRVTVKVYIVIVDDRHVDLEPTPFADPDAAVEYARETARSYALRPEDFEEESVKGRLYHATYSVEGDSVWVVEKEMVTTAAKVKENAA